jgi:hypothetical protein
LCRVLDGAPIQEGFAGGLAVCLQKAPDLFALLGLAGTSAVERAGTLAFREFAQPVKEIGCLAVFVWGQPDGFLSIRSFGATPPLC